MAAIPLLIAKCRMEFAFLLVLTLPFPISLQDAKAPPPPEPATPQPGQPDLSGTWLFGGSEMDVTQTGKRIVVKFRAVGTERSPKFGFAPGDISFTGALEGRLVRGKFHSHFPVEFKKRCPEQWNQWHEVVLNLSEDQQTMRGRYDGRKIYQDCSIKAWKSIPILLERPNPVVESEIIDDNDIPPDRPPASDEKPHRIVINRRRSSAPVNEEIALWIGLAGQKNPTVKADRDYLITLAADGGSVKPDQVKIGKGAIEGRAMVQANKAGDVRVSASADFGLEKSRDSLTFCEGSPIDHLQLVSDREVARADNTEIMLALKFVDKDGKPTHGNQPKAVDFRKEGVGEWRAIGIATSRDFTVQPKECVGEAQLRSMQPGQATVTVSFAKVAPVTRVFEFYVEMGAWLLFWAGIGGTGGTFVRIFQRGFQRRSVRYYAIQFTVGIIAGITLLLACYFGLLPFAPSRFPSGFGIGLLLGIVGGYLGAKTMEIVTNRVAGGGDA